MEKLTITKDKVLEAASKCDTAKQTLKILFPEVFKEEVTYSIGQRFIELGTGIEYLLCLIQPKKVCLINLQIGNRYLGPIKVIDPFKISSIEFIQMSSGMNLDLKNNSDEINIKSPCK